MKHHSPTIAQETKTTVTDVVRWTQELDRLHARIAPRFARPEPRRRALAFLHGILSNTSRKNGWQLAEHAREARPDGMQRLLSSAVWETDGVRDDLRTYTLEYLGNQSAIVAIDETSFPKQGKKSAGVGVQYCGPTGQVENCQVGVFLAYVTAKGHTPISRELSLPLDWTEDRERCQAAGIDIRRFASRRNRTWPDACWRVFGMLRSRLPGWWQIQSMEATWTCEPGWKTGDILTCWQSRGPEPVGIVTPDGVRRRVEAAQVETFLLAAQDWQRLSMSEGTKGPRLFDWACVPMLHRWEDDGRHWVLIRRSLTDPSLHGRRTSLVRTGYLSAALGVSRLWL